MVREPAANLTSAEDDIDMLRRYLQMPELPYVDLSVQHERQQALQRWPLLAELAAIAAGGR